MKRLNLNTVIRFRLNDRGKDIYYHQFDELNAQIRTWGGKPIEPRYPEVDKYGFSYFQLWHFMSIFGKYCGNGCPEFWTDLGFYIDDEDLEEVITNDK